MTTVSKEQKELYMKTAEELRGRDRRIFQARVVEALGFGGQRYAEREFGWNRRTIRNARRELESGVFKEDNFSARGRKKAEEHLPNLLTDMKEIVDGQTQTDPTFQTTRLYTRMTAKEVRKQLIEQKNYTDEELPQEDAIRRKLNQMGYHLKKVRKVLPKKKSQRQTRSSNK